MGRTTIVVVEDDPMGRLLALDACERAGFDVADFTTADEAALYAERMPDSIAALVTDVTVPGERDGIDLAREIRERWPSIAVLVTSGRFGPGGPDGCSSISAFVPKPWTAKVLMAELRRALDAVLEDGLHT